MFTNMIVKLIINTPAADIQNKRFICDHFCSLIDSSVLIFEIAPNNGTFK